VVSALFLNYHHHLTHHNAPQVPWLHLPKLVSPDSAQPSFWRIYLRMWCGPRRIERHLAAGHQIIPSDRGARAAQ
jgi:hypothetical protein